MTSRKVVPLPGIPERYWPSPDKPWRVIWGIGMFEDFATENEAWQHFRILRTRSYEQAVMTPFNACSSTESAFDNEYEKGEKTLCVTCGRWKPFENPTQGES